RREVLRDAGRRGEEQEERGAESGSAPSEGEGSHAQRAQIIRFLATRFAAPGADLRESVVTLTRQVLMRLHPLSIVLGFVPRLAACSTPSSSADAASARVPPAVHRPLPALEDATWVWDSRAHGPLRFGALLDVLADSDVVFVGETHLDDTTHRVEL